MFFLRGEDKKSISRAEHSLGLLPLLKPPLLPLMIPKHTIMKRNQIAFFHLSLFFLQTSLMTPIKGGSCFVAKARTFQA